MPDAAPIILAVDDQQLVLNALARKARRFDVQFVGARSVFAAFDELQDRRPDLILLDLGFNDGTDPYAAIRMFRERCPRARLVVHSGKADVPVTVKCMLAGAHNVLRKCGDTGAIEQEVYEVVRRRAPEVDPLSAEEDRRTVLLQKVDEDQRAVIQGLLDGLTRQQIAARAGCSDRSVYRHIKGLCQELGVEYSPTRSPGPLTDTCTTVLPCLICAFIT